MKSLRAWGVFAGFLTLAGGLSTWLIIRPPNVEATLREARVLLDAGRNAEAYALLRNAVRHAPDSPHLLINTGEAAAKTNHVDEALRFYGRVPDDGSRAALIARGASGDLLYHLGRLSDAERCFRTILEHDPRHAVAHRRMATLLVAEGRRWESTRHLLELVRLGQFTVEDLIFLGNAEELFEDADLVARSRKAVPDDPVPQLGTARLAFQAGETERAEIILRKIIAVAPEQLDAQASLGRLLEQRGNRQAFLKWHSQLPPMAESHPAIWTVRGLWAQKQGEERVAVRCFWEAVRRNANDQLANYRLSQLLVGLGDDARAEPFVERSQRLTQFCETLRPIFFHGLDLDAMQRAATLAESLGRLWEAWGWYYAIAFHFPDCAAAGRERDRLRRQVTAETPLTLPSANPARQVDLSTFPRPRWRSAEAAENAPLAARCAARAIRFEDEAQRFGIDFQYDNGDDPTEPGMYLFQNFGGGVAAFDYDGDLRPDLYFTQAGNWPPDPEQRETLDRLFRNDAGTAHDVTEQAGLGDNGFSGGATCGDFDSDGFPDLYVANIGRNRLYRNNGDGTFTDVTNAAGITAERWTTSCLMADLDGDSHPEIYDVNYLSGRGPFELRCGSDDPQFGRSCKPTMFDAEQDQLLWNLGDGRFQDVTSAAGIVAPDGKGLGIVAATLFDTDGLDLMVANDTTANFAFANVKGRVAGRGPQFREQAALSGLGFDLNGRMQACMGIGCADANGDERLDLFVTNFYNEFNTLYLQEAGGTFRDATQPAGLAGPSYEFLGFGTQFLDADLDGWADLVVANGHVDDFTHKNVPFRMRPQCFANLGRGRFAELAPESLGRYFQEEHLGRGLARLDWNRDGRNDFAVSHLDSPAALVMNHSASAGNFLALQLRGIRSNRDAIGTIVRVVAAGRPRMGQLTAGDGYQACNERRLVFGLGTEEIVEELVVRWPSGLEQSFQDVPANIEWMVLEGTAQLYESL